MVVQWMTAKWKLRAAEMMMPTLANGLALSWSRQTHTENSKLERQTSLLGHAGSLTLLSFVNHANMAVASEK